MGCNAMKKVVYVAGGSSFYGANKSMFFLVNDLKARYNISPVVITNEKGILVDKLKDGGINVIVVPYPNRVVNSQRKSWVFRKWIKKVLRALCFPVCYYLIRAQLQDVSIVHSNSGTIDFGYYLSKKIGAHHIWHIREFGYLDYKLEYIDTKKTISKQYSQSTIITVSNAMSSYLEKEYGLNGLKMIYNGISIPNDYEKKSISGLTRFCIVGKIRNEKGQIDVIKAVKLLKDEGIDEFTLDIYGDGDEQYVNSLKEYVMSNSLGNFITFKGYVDDIYGELIAEDIGIMPSHSEAFGRVTIEYMANYMPVIGCANAGTEEIIEESKTGFLYNAGDISALFDCMRKCISDFSMVKEMGKSARKKAESFNYNANTDRVYQVYKEIMI